MAHDTLLDFVVKNLRKASGQYPEIAKVTGISVHAVRKIAQRQHENPHLYKLEKLARYFRRAA